MPTTSAEHLDARRLQIRCRQPVEELLAGEYLSAFRGRGIEFDEVRPYAPGDEVRSIDWNVTARTGVPHVKRYIEERELRVYLLVDVSASGTFGSNAQTKRGAAAEIATLLGLSAIANGDRVGVTLFSDRIEHVHRPTKGTGAFARALDALLTFEPESAGTRISCVLDHLGAVAPQRSLVFLISDFRDHGFEDALTVASRHHEFVAVPVSDPGESEVPAVGMIRMRDPESGERVWVDTAAAGFSKAMERAESARQAGLRHFFEDQQIDHLPVIVGEDYAGMLHAFLRARIGNPSHG